MVKWWYGDMVQTLGHDEMVHIHNIMDFNILLWCNDSIEQLFEYLSIV